MKKFLNNVARFFISEFGLSALTVLFDFLIGLLYIFAWLGYFPFCISFIALNRVFQGPLIPIVWFFATSFLQFLGICAELLLLAKIGTALGAALWILILGIFSQYLMLHPTITTNGLSYTWEPISDGIAVLMAYSYIMLFLRYMSGYRVFYTNFGGNEKHISIDQ